MADIFSPISATPQIFTSKSRPPFPQPMGMNVLGRHNQLPTPAVPVAQPLKVTQKRRHADDSDDDMERRSQSPSPEKRILAPSRSRKLAPKRARVDADNGDLDSKETSKNSEAEVDVADARVLLANLPLSSYPTMVQALLEKEPSITKLLISVIPRPSAEAAREAIVQATKQLRDAIPYSAAQSAASAARPQYAGVGGRTLGTAHVPAASSTSSALGLTTGVSGFGALSLDTGSNGTDFNFGSSAPSTSAGTNSASQRDAYVMSRLRPAIQAFTSTVHAYLPYFSLIPAPVSLSSLQRKPSGSSLVSSKPNDQQPHPDETFIFLASLTNSILSLPSKVVSALNEQSSFPDRLMKEWKAWLDHLDVAVNTKGEMFSGDQARSWIHALDSFAMGNTVSTSTAPGFGSSFAYGGSSGFGAGFGFGGPSAPTSGWGTSSGAGGWGNASSTTNMSSRICPTNNLPELKNLRDAWVEKVGWLVGRQPPVPGFEAMDEI